MARRTSMPPSQWYNIIRQLRTVETSKETWHTVALVIDGKTIELEGTDLMRFNNLLTLGMAQTTKR